MSVASTKKSCGGCLSHVEGTKYMTCCNCKQVYDLICANVSEHGYLTTMTSEHKATWRCVTCVSRMPKKDNTHTPVRTNVSTRRGGSVPSPTEDTTHTTSRSDLPVVGASPYDQCSQTQQSQIFIEELRAFREEMRATRVQMANLTSAINNLSQRVDECELRVDRLNARVDTMELRFDESPRDNHTINEMVASIEQLKAEINERDQDLLLNDLELSCVPEQKMENVHHIVVTLASKLGVKLEETDVVSAHRVGRVQSTSEGAVTPRPRLIVVRLARRAVRNQLLQAARVRRGATTEGTDLPAPPRRFYVNERLTLANRQLFQRAREIGGHLKWRFVWSRDGRIFARQSAASDSPRQRIRSLADMAKVFGPDAVRSPEISK